MTRVLDDWSSLDRVVRRAGVLVGYGVLGLLSTVGTALIALNLSQPVQPVVYDLFYLRVGPSAATENAILAHFLLAGFAGLSTSLVVGELLSDRGTNARALGWAVAALLALVLSFLVVAFAGLDAFLTVLLVLGVALVGVPLALRYQAGVRSGALPAFVGGIPAIIVLLLLAGFGIGWGWGYIVVAEEVPDASGDGPTADFRDIPEIRDDLFVDGDCDTTSDGRRECRLSLRGYEHELRAVQYLDRYGVRCPYQSTHSGQEDAVFTVHNGTTYRVTCSPHGD